MIRIKAVDAQNILDVCELTTTQDGVGVAMEGRFCRNAVSIAEANYHPEMHPNAIYHNNVLIGFFMYQRAENQADTATILRFMVDDRFQQKGLEGKALEHVLRGLKIQGVRKVSIVIEHANETVEDLCRSFGFRCTGEADKAGRCYELAL